MANQKRSLLSIKSFSILAIFFAIAFVLIAWGIEFKQAKVMNAAMVMQEDTIPEVLRLQRTGRNLEQIRSTGDQLISIETQADRQDLLMLLTILTTHPSIQRYPKIGQIADDVAIFLTEASIEIERSPETIGQWRKRWEPVAQDLYQSADEVMTQAANLMSGETNKLSEASRSAGNQMLVAMTLMGGLILLFIFILELKILRPLLKVHKALLSLHSNNHTLDLPKSNVLEIEAIEASIIALDDLKIKNEEIKKELTYQANHDVLTSLPNRRLFMHNAERTLSRINFEGKHAVIGIIDIDFFKQINDKYSHVAGDQVLQQFAQLLESSFRPTDLICRYGGEEFAFILLDADLEGGKRLSERLRASVEKKGFVIPGDQKNIHLTICIGLAEIGSAGLETSIALADQALYQAKRDGRNRIVTS